MNVLLSALAAILLQFPTSGIQFHGTVGQAVDSSYFGRLSQFIDSPESPAITMFEKDVLSDKLSVWRGEHAGKWLYAASLAVERTGDPEMRERLRAVADRLVSLQEEDGYLGCYLPGVRFTDVPPKGVTNVSWDIWINTYMMKGLAEASKALGDSKYLDSACRIADLVYETCIVRGRSIADMGHHTGLVGIGSIEPLTELYGLRPKKEYRRLIGRCIEEMDSTPSLGLLTLLRNGQDIALAGDAKIYETLRCLTGLARWARITGDKDLARACENGWRSVRDGHLTPLGGPWGGVNVNAEVFNRDCCFSPKQVTETCSSMEWMHFCREMFLLSGGEKKYFDEIEKTFYNALLGARKADGIRWVYYTRTNGEVGPGNEWSCCWSSGMIAMEDAAGLVYSACGKRIKVGMYADCDAAPGGFALSQSGDYAHTGKAEFRIGSSGRRTLLLRIPDWAGTFDVEVCGKPFRAKVRKGYAAVRRNWKEGDSVSIAFPFEERTIRRERRYENDGKFSARLMKTTGEYGAIAKGPLVYCFESEGTVPEGREGLVFVPFADFAATTESPYRSIWFEIAP